MDLTLNYSFAIQLATFVILWIGLKRLLFDPVLQVLDARVERTVAAQAEAERMIASAEAAREAYEQSIHDLRVEMAHEAAAARTAAQDEYQRALAEARMAATEELMVMRAAVAAQVETARRSLAAQADAVAAEMLERVTRRGARVRRLLSIALAALLPVVALASEAEHPAPHGVPWLKLLFSAVNVLIFLAVLRSRVWPALRQALRSRRERIIGALEQAGRAKRESERLQAEWRERLANVSAELEAMRQQARADIAAERDQILNAARQVADAIRRDARRTAEQEVRNAEALLRAEVAANALAIARRLAPQRLTAVHQREFISDFMHGVQP